jgi:hypothetical protein
VFLVAEIWHAHAEAAKSIAGAGELVVGTQTQQPSSNASSSSRLALLSSVSAATRPRKDHRIEGGGSDPSPAQELRSSIDSCQDAAAGGEQRLLVVVGEPHPKHPVQMARREPPGSVVPDPSSVAHVASSSPTRPSTAAAAPPAPPPPPLPSHVMMRLIGLGACRYGESSQDHA